ncbi:hypothetical protein [Streptomyces aureus]|uniref:hypothetical protein n=1 Tax=Streptomyces aureus TaxID=193461 RepID=UPI0036CB6B01
MTENAGLVEELAGLLPAPRDVVQVTVAGERSVAAESGGALALSEATLRQHERVLGDSHDFTLLSRFNLAIARQEAEGVEQGSAGPSVTRVAPPKPSTAD